MPDANGQIRRSCVSRTASLICRLGPFAVTSRRSSFGRFIRRPISYILVARGILPIPGTAFLQMFRYRRGC
eukprot:366077-Prorocentrum_minimum.AAC.1